MSREDRGRRPAGPAGETGAVRKEWGGKIRVALIYPNRYGTAMSNLGFLLVHAGINARSDALCERFFLAGPGGGRTVPPRGGPRRAGRWKAAGRCPNSTSSRSLSPTKTIS